MSGEDVDRTLTEAATLLSRAGVFERQDLVEVPHDYYALGDEIARGGMGRITTARDLRSGRIVAIKEVLTEVLTVYPEAERDEVLARFCREAVLTARLEHPSIVPVYEIGRFGDAPFFAMKRVTGEPLDDHMKAAESFEERLALLPKIAAVADAIAYAHDRGVIHRDLKPNNVLVGEFGETLVIDWGLAKDIGVAEGRDEAGLTDSLDDAPDSIDETLEGSVIGTPQYMPPEQARGEAVDRRADVYALGAILYHVLAGEPPYPIDRGARGNPIVDVLRRVREEAPTPLGELAPDTPGDLLSIVAKAMARDRDERYANAGELAADLASFQRGQLVAVHDYSAGELLRRWLRRHRAALITAAVLLTVLVAAGVWFTISNHRAMQQAQLERNKAMLEREKADDAINRWVSMFAQRGRAELHRGDIATAALILSETYVHRPDSFAVRTMMGDATRAISPLERVFRVAPRVDAAARVGDKLAVFTGGEMRIVDLTGRRVSSRPHPIPRFLTTTRDGELVVTGREQIEILDRDGRTLRTMATEQRVSTIAVNDTGEVIAVGGDDGLVEVFDSGDGERIARRRIERPGDVPNVSAAITVLAFKPGTTELLAVTPFKLELFRDHRLTDTTFEARVNEHFISGSLSRTHPRMVLGTTLGKAILFDTNSGKAIAFLDGHEGATRALFDTSGERVVTMGEKSTRVWDVGGELLSAMVGWNTETRVIRFGSGSRLAVGGLDGTMRIVDVETGRLRARLVGHAKPIDNVEFFGDRLASISEDGVVKLWDGAADLRSAFIPMKRVPNVIVHGDRILTSVGGEPIQLWEASGRRLIAELPGSDQLMAMSHDGRLVATSAGLFDAASGRALERFDLGEPGMLAVDDLGRMVVGASVGTLSLRDRSGSLIRELEPPGRVGLPAFDRGRIILPSFGAAYIYDINRDRYLALEPFADNNGLLAHAVSGDGRRIALSNTRGTVLYDLDSGDEIARTAVGSAALSYHPTEDLIAISTSEEVYLWRPPAAPVPLETPRRGMAGRARFSRTGKTLVTADRPVRLWDVATRTILVERDIGPRVSQAHLADGDQTLILSDYSGLSFWDIQPETRSPEQIRDLVAEKVPRDFRNDRGVISRRVPAVR